MLYDILRVMTLEDPILGTFGQFSGAGSDLDDPTLSPLGPYPFLSLNPCTAIQASLNSIRALFLGQLNNAFSSLNHNKANSKLPIGNYLRQ